MPLERKYLVPIAKVLQSIFGAEPPFELGDIFADLPQLPASPTTGTQVAWEKWLKQCSDEQLRLVLLSLVADDEPAASAALKELARQNALRNNTFAQLSAPVVNRKKLLALLKGMLTEERRILRIDGERGKGKSFTAEILKTFLEKGASGTNDHVVITSDVLSYANLDAFVNGILDLDLGFNNVNLPPADDTTTARRLEHLAELLVTRAMRAGETRKCTYWIVIDRCTPKSPDHLTFFHHLSQVIANHAGEPRVPRLVLIEASPEVGERQASILQREQIDAVLRDDIRVFFEEHTRLSGTAPARRQMLRQEKHLEYTANVAKAMDTAGPDDTKLRLTLMGEEIQSILRKAATDGDYVDV